MKLENFPSPNWGDGPELPADFARNVVRTARAVQRRRRRSVCGGSIAILLAALVPLANQLRSPRQDLAASQTSSSDVLLARQADDQANDLRLAQALTPYEVDDYLAPNVDAVQSFAATYSDASWDSESEEAADQGATLQ
jgi:hypothetical protein